MMRNEHEDLRSALKRAGWKVHSSHIERLVFAKTIQSAVGPKSAAIWVVCPKQSQKIRLSGEFWSEGRNILEPCFTAIDTASAETPEALERFLEEVERRIAESYAVRLLESINSKQGEKEHA